MIKHVGLHKKKKSVIVFREVPGESDQALIVYPEKLPSLLHDEMMACLESPSGQQSNSINEVFFRTIMADGNSILTSLHAGGYMIKVPTNSVMVTPTTDRANDIQLDKLNDLVNKISSGEPMGKDLGEPSIVENVSVLSDRDLAESQKKQAAQMKAEAKRLLEEANRLEKEAMSLSPKNARTTKKTTTKKQKAAA
jgi:hypothetical protein